MNPKNLSLLIKGLRELKTFHDLMKSLNERVKQLEDFKNDNTIIPTRPKAKDLISDLEIFFEAKQESKRLHRVRGEQVQNELKELIKRHRIKKIHFAYEE